MRPKTHLPCSDCGSSDALSDYGDGTYCFSCGTYKKKELDTEFVDVYNSSKEGRKDVSFLSFLNLNEESSFGRPEAKQYNQRDSMIDIIPYRGVSYQTYKDYNCTFEIDKATNKPLTLRYPYLDFQKNEEGAKIRNLERKAFLSEGKMGKATLFGKHLFPAGGKTITIHEGEQDALSGYQMSGKYPNVSVRSSATARTDCEAEFKYINSFEKIYLCFDNDDPGQKALKEVAALFDPNKVYHVKLQRYKDANDYLDKNDTKAFLSEWWNSRPYLPKGILADYDSIADILSKDDGEAICSFPFPTMDSMMYGIHSKKLYLFKAQEKVGKTEVMRTIEHHVLKTTDLNIGIIHLEEGEKRSVQGLVGCELKKPVHFPDSGMSKTDVLETYKSLTKRPDRCFFYTHFGSKDPETILEAIRYLVVVCHCKVIFLDHITLLVTGFEADDERKKLDYISTSLAMLTRELDFSLFLVSHVNEKGDTRGSKNISKVADLIVSLERNIKADTLEERNKTKITIEGNRDYGLSGPAGTLWFDTKTFTLSEMGLQSGQEQEAQRVVVEAMASPDHRTSSLWAGPTQVEVVQPPPSSN